VMYGPYDGGWWGFGMMVMSFLFLAAIVVGVIFIARSFSQGDQTRGPDLQRASGNRALDILDERFARGEINQQEYEERRRVLSDRR
jgi:putative membrane protein